jgi:hypothetical protein
MPDPHKVADMIIGSAAGLRRDAEGFLFRRYLSLCVSDLVGCGLHLAKQRGDMSLSEGERSDLYSHFSRELGDIVTKCDVVAEVPEAVEVVNFYFLPRLPDQVKTLRRAVTGLRKHGYMSRKDAAALMFLLYGRRTEAVLDIPRQPPASAPPPEPAGIEAVCEEPATPACTPEQRINFLISKFGMDTEMAQQHESARTLAELGDFYNHLTSVVGEATAQSLIRINPNLLRYEDGDFAKYLKTISNLLEALAQHNESIAGIEEEFGLRDGNLEMYADLETILSAKQQLFGRIRELTALPAKARSEGGIDVEEYKKRLIERAGLDVEIVRALTSGKTITFVGEAYVPAEYFRKNTARKIAPQKMDSFASTFDELVRQEVIVPKAKANPVFRFNPRVNDITNPYMREYMRLTLYAEKIIAQEGELKLDEDIVKELYPSNGKGAKKPL